MVDGKIDSLESKIYKVHSNLTTKEVVSIENGFDSRPQPLCVILKKNKGKTKSKFNDKFFAHSKYVFYNNELDETNIDISDWILLNVYELENHSREVIYSISDPLGEIREISNFSLCKIHTERLEYFQIDGICKVIGLLRDLSAYPDWTYYDLAVANKQFKADNQDLLQENELLKERNEKLTLSIEKLTRD